MPGYQQSSGRESSGGLPKFDINPMSPLHSNSDMLSFMNLGSGGLEELWGPYSDSRPMTDWERSRAEDDLALGHPDWNTMTDEEKQAEKDALTDERVRGKAGYAGTRIRAHYGHNKDVKSLTTEQRHQKLDLDSEEGRLDALSNMRQNSNPLSADGTMQCGASSLVAGALYGGGKQGIQTLLTSIDADRAKGKMGGTDYDTPELQAIRKKLEDPDAQLTAGDLEIIQASTYRHFREAGGNKGVGGLKGKDLQDFIERHPGMKGMFEAKDMGLDSIDLNGDGTGEHLVLGIGHTPGRNGTRRMVYDPQARQDKSNWGDFMDPADVERIHYEERRKMQERFDEVNKLDPYDPKSGYSEKIDKLNAELDANTRIRQHEYKHDSQLVTDAKELRDYRTATDYEANADGINQLDAQTKPEYGMPGYGM